MARLFTGGRFRQHSPREAAASRSQSAQRRWQRRLPARRSKNPIAAAPRAGGPAGTRAGRLPLPCGYGADWVWVRFEMAGRADRPRGDLDPGSGSGRGETTPPGASPVTAPARWRRSGNAAPCGTRRCRRAWETPAKTACGPQPARQFQKRRDEPERIRRPRSWRSSNRPCPRRRATGPAPH